MGKSSKNKKILIVMIIAAVLCIGAGMLTFKAINSQKVTIYTFNDNYKAGTVVNTDMLAPVKVDKQVVTSGGGANIASVFVTEHTYQNVIKEGDTLRVDVTQGMVFTPSILTKAGGNAIEAIMKPDAIAVTLDVDSVTGITNDLSKGSYVNVGTVVDEELFIHEALRVLAVNYTAEGEIISVTVECDMSKYKDLIYASDNGYIHLGLINSSGYQHSENESVDSRILETESETSTESN